MKILRRLDEHDLDLDHGWWVQRPMEEGVRLSGFRPATAREKKSKVLFEDPDTASIAFDRHTFTKYCPRACLSARVHFALNFQASQCIYSVWR